MSQLQNVTTSFCHNYKNVKIKKVTISKCHNFKMSQFQDVTISKCHNFKVLQFQNVTISKCCNFKVSQFQNVTITKCHNYKLQYVTISRFHNAITKKNLSHEVCHIFMGIKDFLDRNWIVVQCVDVCVLLDLLDAIRH